jgi:4-amino-4-deoxy-L-arabinose transferase-like glycosyltransferase
MLAHTLKQMSSLLILRNSPGIVRSVALGSILVVTFCLLIYQLPNWPVIWFDEGVNLQVSKNLAQLNQYGIASSDGFRPFDPWVTTGPTVLVPIALAFKLMGIGLLQARLVMALYSLLTVFFFFLLAEHLFGTKVALLSSLLLLVSPVGTGMLGDTSGTFLGLSRMVMGEIPALLFILVGTLSWFRWLDMSNKFFLLNSGIMFGLAFVTKPQTLLIIVVFAAIWFADRLWSRQLQWPSIVVPVTISLLSFLLWRGYQTVASGHDPTDFGSDIDLVLIQAASGFGLFRRNALNVLILLKSGALIWGIPGLLYGLGSGMQRDKVAVKHMFMLSIVIVWILWFVLASIGWIRYAFVGLMILQILTAKLLVDLAGGFANLKSLTLREGKLGFGDQTLKQLAIFSAMVLMVLVPLQERVRSIISAELEPPPIKFTQVLHAHVPEAALIETFEPEIVFLSDRTFHQPTASITNAAIKYVQFGQTYSTVYDLSQIRPDYIVNGPFGKWTDLYVEELTKNNYTLVASIDGHDLYKFNGLIGE